MPAQVPFNTIPQLFTRLADHYEGQQRPALRYKADDDTWQDITWSELQERVQSLAGHLHEHGVRSGDRVALLSENRPEWAITDLATQILGGINVPIFTSLPPQKIAYILRDSGASALIVSVPVQRKKVEEIIDECPDLEHVIVMSELPENPPGYMHHWDDAMSAGAAYWTEHAESLITLREDVDPSDSCAFLYTSGTTGQPKGVMLSHQNFASNIKALLKVIPFGDSDHHLSFLPLSHAFERTTGYYTVMAAGATISYAENIDAVSRNLLETSPTVMISVPRLFEKVYTRVKRKASEGSAIQEKLFNWAVDTGQQMAEARSNGGPGPWLKLKYRLAHRLVFSKLHEKLGGNLRFAASGGAALPEKIGTFFQAAGIKIIEGYGLTETAPVLTVNPLDAPRYGTVGHVLPGVTVAIQRLSDETIVGTLSGGDYPSDLTTEEGEILARGPNVMEKYWQRPEDTRAAFDTDGWYHTGDVGRFDNGYLMVTDRIKHMIVSGGGKNIYPGPIEDEFKTLPWIDQIMIVGEGRPFLAALIVPDFESLRLHARDRGVDVDTLDDEDLTEHEEVRAIFEEAFREYSYDAPAHEKIRDFTLLSEPFTTEDGSMTPTMKLKRNVITERYADEIDAMYERFQRRGV